MEEFKNLEEIIELCEEELDKNDENVHATLDFEDLKELQNLINKYKEQEEHIEEYKLNVKEVTHEAQENARIFRKEQAKKNEYKKMVELMADIFVENEINMEEICMESDRDCNEPTFGMCKECVIEFFRKKAKGE